MSILIPGILILLILLSYNIRIYADISIRGKDSQLVLDISMALPVKWFKYSFTKEVGMSPAFFPPMKYGEIFSIIQRMEDTLTSLRNANYHLGNIMLIVRKFLRHIFIEDFQWKTRLGLDDAGNTAILSGGLWAFKGALVSILSSLCRIEKINIDIQPEFNQAILDGRIRCIFKIRSVHIIFTAVYVFYFLIRGYINGYATASKRKQPSY